VAKHIVDRDRPLDVLTHVVVRGAHLSHYGYPSSHAAVAAALATAAMPYIPRYARRTNWLLVAIVALARIYVGAHFPLDVIGGVALGWSVGALVNLAVGTTCKALDPKLVRAALALANFPVGELTQIVDDGTDTTPFLATAADGRQVFVKALDREHRNADALATIGRYVAFRHFEAESPLATTRQRVEHEALSAAFAAQAGVGVARPLAIAAAASGPSVVVFERIEGRTLCERDDCKLDDATLAALWQELTKLRAARIAHGHLSLDNIMVDNNGAPWIVGFSHAVVGASDRDLTRDVAQLLVATSLVVGPDKAIAAAVNGVGKDAIIEALPMLQPLALASSTRHAARRHKGYVDELRNKAADAVGVEHVKLEEITRVKSRQIIMLAFLFVAVYALLPQLSELSKTVDATRHADITWLVLAAFTSAGTFAAAALSLSGAVLVPLAYGRTFLTQLASSFSNKITPAGLGGMGVNVRYLQRSGVSRTDAVGAVALNGTVGFVVHIVAMIVFVTAFGRTGFGKVHFPSVWLIAVIVVIAASLVGVILETSFGRKHILTPTRRTAHDLWEVLRRPTKAAQMLGGAVLVLASYVVALGLALMAFHAHASWLDVATVYIGGSAVASAAPTPGKIGAVEAALIAGLRGVNVASGPAVAGVLAFRLVTFWLPIAPGYLAFHSLTKRELL